MPEELMAPIEDAVARFRMGEAEVARVFFSEPRPRRQHAGWLRVQVTRELRNLREIQEGLLQDLVERVDRTAPREELVERLMEDFQEARHYAVLAYLLEGVSGEDVDWQELNKQRETADWFTLVLQENARGRELATISPLHGAAAAFTRGGGGSLFHGMVDLAGSTYEELLAGAARMILHDELEHGASEGRDLLYPLVNSEADRDLALGIVNELSTLRIRLRNKQFGHPLTEERIEAIAAGDIEPATVDMLWASCQLPPDDHEWFARFHSEAKPLASATITDEVR